MTKNNQSVAKALQIIEVMAASTGPMRLQDISAAVALPASTVLRFLGTLTDYRYVRQDEQTLQYSLTMKFCRLGYLVSSQVRLRDVVHHHLLHLTELFRESASLAIQEEQRVLYIDCVDGPDHMLQTLQRIGKVAPLNSTGVGKILLTTYSPQQIDELEATRSLEASTKNTITDKAALQKELRKVERAGFAVDNEECELGVKCVAAPIRDYTGRIVAAISMSGPVSRMTAEKMSAIREGVTATASEISASLGYLAELTQRVPPAEARQAGRGGMNSTRPGAPSPPRRRTKSDRR